MDAGGAGGVELGGGEAALGADDEDEGRAGRRIDVGERDGLAVLGEEEARRRRRQDIGEVAAAGRWPARPSDRSAWRRCARSAASAPGGWRTAARACARW